MKVKNLRLRIPQCFMNAEFGDMVLGSGLINAFNLLSCLRSLDASWGSCTLQMHFHSPQHMDRCTGGHPVFLGRDSGRRLMVKHLEL